MKKFISLLLSIVMLISAVACVDLSAFADDNDVTNRAEWLAELVDVFDMTIESDNYPDNYFSDLTEDSEYYYDVLLAVEFGLVDIEAGDPVDPEGEITREFAAQTLNFCLKYQLEDEDGEDYEYTFSDYEQCEYPYDDQVAVNRGWFELDEDDQFCPDQVVTSDEIDIMLTDARETIEGDEVDENYDSTYEYDNGVIEISSDTEVEFSVDNVIIIYDTDYSINSGDTIVVYSYGIPLVYDVEEVTVNSDNISVKVTDSANENAIVNVDMQEVFDVNADDFIPAEGYEIVDEAESVAYTNGIAPIASSTPQENSVKISKKFEIDDDTSISIEIEISDIKLSVKENTEKQSITAKVEFDMSFIVDAEFDLTDLVFDGFDDLGIFGSIPIAGIGYVELKPDVNFGCKTELSQSYNVVLGFTKDNNGTHNISSFKKGSFTYVFEGSCKLGVRVEVGVTILIAKIDMYAEIGVLAKVSAQTTIDSYCLTLSAYMYYNLGVEYEIDFAFWQSNGGIEWQIFDENNSPIRLYFHFEDGKSVDECMAGKQKYVSPKNTVYGRVSEEFSNNYNESVSYGLKYASSNNTATIISYSGTPKNLYIPEYIDGYLVIGIDRNAFNGCDSLTSVRMPDTVSTIDSGAFSGCSNLTNIVIPNSVTSIGSHAFENCISLTNITIPNSVTSIGKYTFESCDSLASATIGNSVTSIGDNAFFRCSSLSSVTIGNSVETIGINAFEECTSLANITIPNNVTSIDQRAFYACSSLTSVTIPNSVTSLGDWAFSNCTSLTNVTIADSVTDIGHEVFEYCDSLTDITVDSKNSYYSSLDGVLFNKDKTELIQYSSGNERTSYTIPNGVTNIDTHAFVNSSKLTSIRIPISLMSIEPWAFEGCSNITNIYYTGTKEQWRANIFNYLGNSCLKNAMMHFENGIEQEHNYAVIVTAPTCTEEGYTTRICSCGVSYVIDYVSATGHTSNNVTITKAATCTTTGTKTYKCTVCGEIIKTETIAATGHKPDNGTVTKAATCTATGTKTYKCTVCGVTTKTETIAKTGHKAATDKAVAATCTKDGKTAGSHCSVCGTVITAQTTVKATGHSYDSGKVTKEATYTAIGVKTYTCTKCGATKTETIAKKTAATPKISSVSNVVAGVKISWGKVTGAEKYRVFYKTGNGSWTKAGDTTGTSYTWTEAKNNTKYSFTVRCMDKDGNYISSYDSSGMSITFMSAPTVSVSNVVAGVKVSWGKVSGASNYAIFRKTPDGSYKKIGTATGTSYVDKTAKNNTKYIYAVRCATKDGKTYTSSYNAGKSITFMSAPTVSVSNVVAGVKVSWGKVSGVSNYAIFRKTPNGSYKKIGTATGTSFTDTTAKNNTKYVYAVRCASKDGKTYTSSYNAGKSITFMSAPTFTVSKTSSGVQIKWSKVTGASNYKVYRKTANGSYKAIGTTTGTNFVDKTAKKGTKYIYTVRCVSKDGKTATSSYNAGKSITR